MQNSIDLLNVVMWVFIRAAVLLPLVWVAFWCVRRRSASVRHGVLLVGLVCLFVLPVLPFAGPRLSVPDAVAHSAAVSSVMEYAPVAERARVSVPEYGSGTGAGDITSTIMSAGASLGTDKSETASYEGTAEVPHAKQNVPGFVWQFWVLGVWLTGFCLFLLRLGLSHAAAWRLARQGDSGALSVVAGDFLEGAARIVVSDRVAMPMTWGVAPAVVLLPSGAADWPAERIRAVLLHERAHVRRRDWLVQLLSEVARAAYWGHPFVWVLVRQLRLEAEMACDDAVLASGLAASSYAGELVECVRQVRRNAGSVATVAMADPFAMAKRVHAVLDSSRSRSGMRRRGALVAGLVGLAATFVVGATWTGKTAASNAGATVEASPSGSIAGIVLYGSTHKPAPGIGVRAEQGLSGGFAITDRDGKFTIGRLKAGTYNVRSVVGPGEYSDWAGMPQVVRVAAGQRSSGTVIPLVHAGIITGKVTNVLTGKPAEKIAVLVSAKGRARGSYFLIMAVTGPDGTYRARTIPGTVYVSAHDPQDPNYFTGHQQVNVVEGETKSINISLSISGHPRPIHVLVVDAVGKPVAGAVVMVFDQRYGLKTVQTDVHGIAAFDYSVLASGDDLRAKFGDLCTPLRDITYHGGSQIELHLHRVRP